MMKKTFGILSAVAMSSVAYADVNVSGYVDAGYDWSNVKALKNDFVFHEGGLWFSGNSGSTSFLIDAGINGPTGAIGVGQGYVSHTMDNGFGWTLGKFDGILGLESGKSVNNTFVHTGLLRNSIVAPVGTAAAPLAAGTASAASHTGLLFGYDLSDALKLNLIVANGTVAANTTDVGFKLGTSMDGLSAAVGGLFTSAGGETGYLIDITASTGFGAFEIGAQLDLVKRAVANADSGLGFGIFAGTEVMAATKLNAAFEWTNKNAGDAKQLRVGPSFAASEALTVKADYTWNKVAALGATHGVALAGVYKF